MKRTLCKHTLIFVTSLLAILPSIAQTPDFVDPLLRAHTPETTTLPVWPSGIITAIAGDGYFGVSGNGGPALKAEFIEPTTVAVDSKGNIFILDSLAEEVRKVNPSTGIILRYAGNGQGGYSGDNGPAISAELNDPSGIAVDSLGNLYIGDFRNNVIRKVNAITGIITTVAGNGAGAAPPPITDYPCEPRVDGVLATKTPLCGPFGLAVDSQNNLYFADFYNYVIRKVNAGTGIITTVAGVGAITLPNGNGNYGYAGDGGPALEAQFGYPTAISIDHAGNLYILDFISCAVRKVAATTGVITSVVGTPNPNGYFGVCGLSGDGGPASMAQINPGIPAAITVDQSGDLFIADGSNSIVRMISASNGNIYTIAGMYSPVGSGFEGDPGFSGDGGPSVYSILESPQGVAVDSAGSLYIADTGNRMIRKINEPSVLSNETPVISPVSKSFVAAIPVSISPGVAGSTIYYTTDGTIPTTESTKYVEPFDVAKTTLVTAFASIPGKPNSQATIAGYLYAPVPAISPGSGTIAVSTKITLTDTNPLAKIYYTADPLGDPTNSYSGILYTGPFQISNSTKVQAAALVSVMDANGKEYSGWSGISSAQFTNLSAKLPAATTGNATAISAGWLTLNGVVTANNAATDCSFEWGTSPTILNNVGGSGGIAVTGTKPTAVSSTFPEALFQPKTTYYFRIVATNAVGTTNASNILSFETP